MAFTTISISDVIFDSIPSGSHHWKLACCSHAAVSVETNLRPTHQRHINRTADEVSLNKLKTWHPFTSLIAENLSQN